MNEDGSCPPIEYDETYEKTVEYDFENECWLITVSERNSIYGQTITKSLKVNGEYAIYFRYSSQEQFMKKYKANSVSICSFIALMLFIILILEFLELIVLRIENSCQKSS